MTDFLELPRIVKLEDDEEIEVWELFRLDAIDHARREYDRNGNFRKDRSVIDVGPVSTTVGLSYLELVGKIRAFDFEL